VGPANRLAARHLDPQRRRDGAGRVRAQGRHEACRPDHLSKEGDFHRAGREALRRIDGAAGEKVIASLEGIAPDLGRFNAALAIQDVLHERGQVH